jgi:peptidyl-tRNA hydrolase, PTH1 family
MSASLVVGLGNPGSAYDKTRHNAGWDVVSSFADRRRFVWKEERAFQGLVAKGTAPDSSPLILLKPLTFMNLSGQSVRSVVDYFKINVDSVCVVYDDLTLSLGRLKVSVSGSDGGHNGVASLLAHLGNGFTRLRLGIGPKHPKEMDLADFVLSRFTDAEHSLFTKNLPTCIEALELILRVGAKTAMNQLNQRPSANEPEQIP